MIFKILSSTASFNAVNYNESKIKSEQAALLHLENFGWLSFIDTIPTKAEIKQYLKDYSARNKQVQKTQFHATLSAKGQENTFEELKEAALKMMQHLGYSDNPMLIYGHNDTDNNHVHIVTSRIDQRGLKINDSFEKKRANQYLTEVLNNRNINQEFTNHIARINQYNITSEANYLLLLEQLHYTPIARKDGDGFEIFKFDEKVGEISKAVIKENIQRTKLSEDYTNRKKQIRSIFDKYLLECKSLELNNANKKYSDQKPKWENEFTKRMKDRFGLEFVFYNKKNTNDIFGYSVIDHANKNVFKGSEILALDKIINTNQSVNDENTVLPKLQRNNIAISNFTESQNTNTVDNIHINQNSESFSAPFSLYAEQELKHQDGGEIILPEDGSAAKKRKKRRLKR